MTIKDLLTHMAEKEYVCVYVNTQKAFEGFAPDGMLELPNCVLEKMVKRIGAIDCMDKTKDKEFNDYSAVLIIA